MITQRCSWGFPISCPFTKGKNNQSADYGLRMHGRFSVYTPLMQSFDTLTRDGCGDFGGNRAGPDVFDPDIDRYRPHIIITEQATTDGSLAKQRARWEAIQRAGRSIRVTLIADSRLDSAGTPWTPNQLAPLSIPSTGLDDLTWVIVGVVYKRDVRSGTTAEIVLMRPSALHGLSMRVISPDTTSGGTTGAAPVSPAAPSSAPNAGTVPPGPGSVHKGL